jgi:hypothetical protein
MAPTGAMMAAMEARVWSGGGGAWIGFCYVGLGCVFGIG